MVPLTWVLGLIPTTEPLACTSAGSDGSRWLMATDPLKSRVPSVSSALPGLYGAKTYSALSSRSLVPVAPAGPDRPSEYTACRPGARPAT